MINLGSILAQIKPYVLGWFGQWQAYTPVWTADGGATTMGNGTLTGRYCQVGKLVTAKIRLVWGTTTSSTGTDWAFTLPMPASGLYEVGSVWVYDPGTAAYIGIVLVDWDGYLKCFARDPLGRVGTTYPMTWANGDILAFSITYEAA